MKNTPQLRKLFDEKELAELITVFNTDKRLTPALVKIIESECSELMMPTSMKDFERPSWPLEKAHREGGAYHLQRLLTILKEK